MTLGQFIRSRRLELGLSLIQASEITGLSKSYLSQIEHGKRPTPSTKSLVSLASALDVPVARLEALVAVHSRDGRGLRLLMRDVTEELSHLPELIANVESLIRLMKSIGVFTVLDSPETADGKPKVGYYPELIRRYANEVAQLHFELKTLNTSLMSQLSTLNDRLESPQLTDYAQDLMERAERLGRDGRRFLIEVIESVEKLKGIDSLAKRQQPDASGGTDQ